MRIISAGMVKGWGQMSRDEVGWGGSVQGWGGEGDTCWGMGWRRG